MSPNEEPKYVSLILFKLTVYPPAHPPASPNPHAQFYVYHSSAFIFFFLFFGHTTRHAGS